MAYYEESMGEVRAAAISRLDEGDMVKKDKGPIDEAMVRLDMCLSTLNDCIVQLEKRIQPVLRASEQKEPSMTEAAPYGSPLYMQLENYVERVLRMRAQVNRMSSEVDL